MSWIWLLTRSTQQAAAGLASIKRVGMPNDVAQVVCFLASDAAEWINGKTIGVDGGAWR